MQQCDQHQDIVTKLAVIQNTLDTVATRICAHIDDGERPGGYRDRVINLEHCHKANQSEIAAVKKEYWKTCLMAGVIGGLLGKLTPEIFNFLIRSVFAG